MSFPEPFPFREDSRRYGPHRGEIPSFVAAGVGLLLSAVALAVSWPFFPIDARRVDRNHGKVVFQMRCGSCHSFTKSGKLAAGPSLGGISNWGAERIPNMSAEEYIFSSIVTPSAFRAPGVSGEMPEHIADSLSDQDLLDVVVLLSDPEGQVDIHEILSLRRPPRTERTIVEKLPIAQVERGRKLFLTKGRCATCHDLAGLPGSALVAPLLSGVGTVRAEKLREALLQPEKSVTEGYEVWAVIEDGRRQSGRKISETQQTLQLLQVDQDGRLILRSFQKKNFEPLENGAVAKIQSGSLMPSYAKSLNSSEVEDIVAFLTTLR